MPRDQNERRCDCSSGVPGHNYSLVRCNRKRDEPIPYNTLVHIPGAEPAHVASKLGVESHAGMTSMYTVNRKLIDDGRSRSAERPDRVENFRCKLCV